MSFRVWLLSLSIMSSRFSHDTHTHTHTHTHVHAHTYSHTLTLLGCLHLLAVVNDVAITLIWISIWVSAFSSFVSLSRSEVAGPLVLLFNFLRGHQVVSYCCCIIWFSHHQCTRGAFSPHPCLCLSSFYFYNHPNECEVTFDLHFLND